MQVKIGGTPSADSLWARDSEFLLEVPVLCTWGGVPGAVPAGVLQGRIGAPHGRTPTP